MIDRGIRNFVVAMFLTAATIGATSLSAAEKPSPPSAEAGRILAEKLCKGCHLVEAKAGAVTPVGPPTFHAMANKPDQTAESIRNVLIVPHVPMPDMHLTKQEIMDIVAFIDSLRAESAGPRLLKPNPGEKMQYPRAG